MPALQGKHIYEIRTQNRNPTKVLLNAALHPFNRTEIINRLYEIHTNLNDSIDPMHFRRFFGGGRGWGRMGRGITPNTQKSWGENTHEISNKITDVRIMFIYLVYYFIIMGVQFLLIDVI